MTTDHHTPHPFGTQLTSAKVNLPLGQLDAAISSVEIMGSGISTTLTAQANSGQKNMVVAARDGWNVNDVFYIGFAGGTAESGVIASGTGGGAGTLVAVANLANTYLIGTPIVRSSAEIVAARAGYATLAGRLSGLKRWISVKDFGATGDGVTTDQTAIQAAIDSAVTGDIVYFPRGTYKITSALSVVLQVSLEGDGGSTNGSVIVQATNNVNGITYAAGSNGAWIRGIKLSGPLTVAVSGYGIDAAADVNLDDVFVYGFFNGMRSGAGAYYTVMVRPMFLNQINAGLILDHGVGAGTFGSNNMVIYDGRFANNKYGIYATGANGLRLFGGSMEASSLHCIRHDGHTAAGHGYGLTVNGVWFESATSQVPTAQGFLLLGPTAVITNVTVRDCTFQPNTTASFWAIDAANMTAFRIEGNMIGGGGAGGGAIRLAATCTKGFIDTAYVLGTITNAATKCEYDYQSMVHVTKAAAQTGLVTSTDTPIVFDTERFDTDGFHDNAVNNTRITIPAGFTGRYGRFSGGLLFAASTAGYRYIAIRKDGATFVAVQHLNPSVGSAFIRVVSDPLLLTAGNYYELVAFQSSGGNLDVSKAADYSPEFSLEVLARQV